MSKPSFYDWTRGGYTPSHIPDMPHTHLPKAPRGGTGAVDPKVARWVKRYVTLERRQDDETLRLLNAVAVAAQRITIHSEDNNYVPSVTLGEARQIIIDALNQQGFPVA